MKRRGIAIVAGVLAGMICTAAPAAGLGDWVAINSPKELRALYSNTTFEGTAPNGSHFVGRKTPDGWEVAFTVKKGAPNF